MDNRLRLAVRELSSLRSEKTIVLALLIQLFIAAFSSFLVVGLVSLTDPGSTTGSYDVELGISGEASAELERIVDQGTEMEPVVYESRETALAGFNDRHIDAVLHVQSGSEGRLYVDAIVPEGDFRTTLIVTQIKEALSELERAQRDAVTHRLVTDPLPVPERSGSNPYFGFTYTILIPVLVFLPAFISGSIATDSLAGEMERGTLELLRVTPLSLTEIIDGKALAMIAIAPAQAALWLVFLGLNGTAIVHPFAILVLVTALTAVLVVAGAALAVVLEVRREAQLTFSLFALAFFAGTLLLSENPPNMVAMLAIGSPTETSFATLGMFVLLGSTGYLLIRSLVPRYLKN